jgi:hypothetical protein
MSDFKTSVRKVVNTEADLLELLKRLPRPLREQKEHNVAAWRRPTADLRRLLKHDYVKSLRRALDYGQIRKLVSGFKQIFPTFNAHSLSMMSDEEFRTLTNRLGVHCKTARYVEDNGMALRGFYVADTAGLLKFPLIFINTAHHRLAAMTTFVHELGHHVACKRLQLDPEPVHFFFDAAYAEHLAKPGELAADLMVCLAGYPEETARKIFATDWNWGLVARAENLPEAAFNEVRRHLKRAYGFDLPFEQMSESQRLHYLTGMIHYAKLRWALLAEYDL